MLIMQIVIMGFQCGRFSVKAGGVSMLPTLHGGEYFVSNKGSWISIRRGDIIHFKPPGMEDKRFIKRVIALPEEHIEVYADGSVVINNILLQEPYLFEIPRHENRHALYIADVPQNAYFVLGDNRGYSNDSRYFGPVPREHIVGKLVLVYWCPVKVNDFFRAFSRFFFPSKASQPAPST